MGLRWLANSRKHTVELASEIRGPEQQENFSRMTIYASSEQLIFLMLQGGETLHSVHDKPRILKLIGNIGQDRS